MKLNRLVSENVRVVTVFLRKWCHSSTHFSELAPHHGGKTAGIDMVWRNYVTVTLCVLKHTPAANIGGQSNASPNTLMVSHPCGNHLYNLCSLSLGQDSQWMTAFTARRSYASAVLRVVILSVRLSVYLSVCYTRALWLIQRTPIFLNRMKGQSF